MARKIAQYEEILEQYQLQLRLEEFLVFGAIPSVKVSDWFREKIRFALLHKGETDKEAFTSESIILTNSTVNRRSHRMVRR